jgi:hypothetical protein
MCGVFNIEMLWIMELIPLITPSAVMSSGRRICARCCLSGRLEIVVFRNYAKFYRELWIGNETDRFALSRCLP